MARSRRVGREPLTAPEIPKRDALDIEHFTVNRPPRHRFAILLAFVVGIAAGALGSRALAFDGPSWLYLSPTEAGRLLAAALVVALAVGLGAFLVLSTGTARELQAAALAGVIGLSALVLVTRAVQGQNGSLGLAALDATGSGVVGGLLLVAAFDVLQRRRERRSDQANRRNRAMLALGYIKTAQARCLRAVPGELLEHDPRTNEIVADRERIDRDWRKVPYNEDDPTGHEPLDEQDAKTCDLLITVLRFSARDPEWSGAIQALEHARLTAVTDPDLWQVLPEIDVLMELIHEVVDRASSQEVNYWSMNDVAHEFAARLVKLLDFQPAAQKLDIEHDDAVDLPPKLALSPLRGTRY